MGNKNSSTKKLKKPCHCEPLCSLPPDSPLPFHHLSRIIIIGAGPSGVHMAHLLKRRGFNKITLLEKGKEIGGKSFSLIHPESGEDVPHEMGTCFMHPGYHRTFELAQSFDYGPYFKTGGHLYDKCNIYSPSLNKEKGEEETKPCFIMDWMYSDVEKRKIRKHLHFLPDKLQMLTVASSIMKYNKIHKEIFGEYSYSLPPRPDQKALMNLDMPFLTFIKLHDLEALIPIFLLGNSAQGYGLLETIPAFYGLWWNSPALLNSLLEKKPLTQMFQNGFQGLWKKVAQEEQLEVIFNAEVISVDRKLGTNDPIVLEVEVEGEKKTFECDFLINSSPFKPSLSFFKDATEEEKELFSPLISSALVTSLYKSKVMSQEERSTTYLPERLRPPFQGRFYAERNSARAIHPEREPPKEIRFSVAYQYFDDVTEARGKEEELKATLVKDLEEHGYEGVEVVYQRVWEYFPRYDFEHIKKHYPWKVYDLQGKNKCWYIGSSACFESVEDVLCYNHLLLRKFHLEEEPSKKEESGKEKEKEEKKEKKEGPEEKKETTEEKKETTEEKKETTEEKKEDPEEKKEDPEQKKED